MYGKASFVSDCREMTLCKTKPLIPHLSAGDPSRTNALSAPLPSDQTGAQLEQRTPIAPSAAALLPPLVVSTSGTAAGPYITVLTDTACNIRFLDGDFRSLGAWSNCTAGDTLIVAPTLDETGTVLVVSTVSGSVFAIDANPGTAGSQLWGPVSLSDVPVASALVAKDFIWLPGTNGTVYRLSLGNGTVTSTPAVPCYASPEDNIYAPLALVPGRITGTRGSSSYTGVSGSGSGSGSGGGNAKAGLIRSQLAVQQTQEQLAGDLPALYVVVTARGCVVAYGDDGSLAWRMESPSGWSSTAAAVTMAPAVDAQQSRIYFASPDGYLCCGPTSGVAPWAPCNGWLTACVSLGLSAGAALVGGLAVSPVSAGFHSGQVYALDSTGVLYAVDAVDGSVRTSGTSLVGSTSAAPIVVPSGLDNLYNAMLAVNHDGLLQALYVGDGPVRCVNT